MTRFLVDGPESADISREALVEAVRALIRERDYLRCTRDLIVGDSGLEAVKHREHAEELEQVLQRESDANRKQAEAMQRELAALRHELATLLRERDKLLADRDAIRADRDAILAARDEVAAERDELLVDRNAWRARATRTLAERVRRTLPNLTGRWFRSRRNTDEER